MDQAAIQSYNGQFTKYEGTIKGSQVRSLIQEAVASNSMESNEDAGRQVIITVNNFNVVEGGTTIQVNDHVQNTASYDVECTFEHGLVTIVNVTDH